MAASQQQQVVPLARLQRVPVLTWTAVLIGVRPMVLQEWLRATVASQARRSSAAQALAQFWQVVLVALLLVD